MFRTRQLALTLYFILGICGWSFAQEMPSLYGAFQSNANFFIRDTTIGAANIPQYDNQKFGVDAWLNLNFRYKNITLGGRYDLFNNSNLLIPTGSYTDQGVGMWFAEISLDKLNLRAGYIYDQIGSGFIFRAYEIRPLLIDNALIGVHANYRLNNNWTIKGFAGQQKNLFSRYRASIRGGALDGSFSLGEKNQVTISPGIGVVARGLGEENIKQLVEILRNYYDKDRIESFKSNTYLATVYNTLSVGGFSLYTEYAHKTKDVFYDLNATRTFINGTKTPGKYVQRAGNIFYSSLSYSRKGFGITLEGRRSENFNFRTDQTLSLNRGLINYIPPLVRQNTYRLTARYSPAIQDVSELGFQGDVRVKLSKSLSTLVNYANIRTLEGEQLYQEVFAQFLYKIKRKWRFTLGAQIQNYNQAVYQGKPKNSTPTVNTLTPFIDVLYRISRKKSIRVESQYMLTKQDYGNWIFGLVEVGLAPHWQFEVSAMYNIKPNTTNPNIPSASRGKKILYPTIGAVYSYGSNRYSLRYVKQVEGVVCSGGVCRLEPAFSGVKFEINSTF